MCKTRHSRNIFIVARGTSKAVGYYLEHLLFALACIVFINDYNLSDSFTRLVNEDDTVILSLSGELKRSLKRQNCAVKRGKHYQYDSL